MIKIQKKANQIIISGHSMYDEIGKDIVCSAVSSVVTTSINAILRYDSKAIDYKQGNELIITILKEDSFVDLLITNMLDLLSDLEKQYPKNIRRC